MIVDIGSINIHLSASESGSGLAFIDKWSDFSNLFTEYSNVSALDMCSGAGELGFKLINEGIATTCNFADIKAFHSASITSTNTANSLSGTFYHSDCFNDVPTNRYDFIICNPPHLISQSQHDTFVKPDWDETAIAESRLDLLDLNLNFHTRFVNGLDNYLEVNGSALLFENQYYLDPSLIIDLLPSNYEYTTQSIDCWPADFYAIKIKRTSE